ncbi:Integrase core domain [Popillia japonica]|uniref:Integrase core domain n=1 Tax=Popillia japonica TaxID=7064 RepID=A0AAW1K2S6_POPJA
MKYDVTLQQLQRLVIRLMKYDVTLQYTPVSDNKCADLRNSINSDSELQIIKHYLRNAWPNNISAVKREVKAYYPYKDEIFELDGFLFKGNRLLIPKDHRLDILTKLHSTHQGVTTCQRKQPIIQHEIPELPWEKIGVDFFQIGNEHYLIACDYHSKFVELIKMGKKDASATTEALTGIFKSHGLPSVIMSDNGPPFDSNNFRRFLQELDITHVTSSPTYSQSNGLIERHITSSPTYSQSNGLIERHIGTLKERNYHVLERLSNHILIQNAIIDILHDNQTKSAAYYNIGRKPLLHDNQTKSAAYYNIGRKPLPLLSKQSVVIQQGTRRWIPGEIIKQVETPESYLVRTQDGGVIRRNRIHLREIQPRGSTPPIEEVSTHSQPENNPDDNLSAHNDKENNVKNHPPDPSNHDKPMNRNNDVGKVSSRGRVIKQPTRLQDYILH